MSGYTLDGVKVLVVDDNKHMRGLLKTLLVAFGIRDVYEAADGEEAFQKLHEEPVDLVLCDLVMEPVDGFQFVQRVRQGEDSPDPFVPIIIVSGYTERFRVAEARDYGVTEVLTKPVSAKELAARISTVVENPRPFVKTKSYFGPDRRRQRDGTMFYSGEERRYNIFAVEDELTSEQVADKPLPGGELDDILDFDPEE